MTRIAYIKEFKDGDLIIFDCDDCYTLCTKNNSTGEIKSVEHFVGYRKENWLLEEVIAEAKLAFAPEISEHSLFDN